MKTNEFGRSMIEMLGVLAIVGVLSVAGISGYARAMEKYKINKVKDEMNQIATNIMTMFSGIGTYKNLNTEVAQSLGVIPESMYKSGEARHAFGGTITIEEKSYGGIEGAAFSITFNGLPQSVAIQLGTDTSYDLNRNLMYVQLGSSN